MERLYITYAVFGTLSVVLALMSTRLRQWPVSEPLTAMVLGIALGPQVLGVVEIGPPLRDPLLLEGSRLLLAVSVMAAALRFPVRDLRGLTPALTVLLVVVMPLAAAITGAASLLLGLPMALALLVGCCLSPTDPVLAASVVSGMPAERDLPARIRQLLTAESGANDGLALPLVGLAVASLLPATTAADAVARLTWEVLGGTVIGLLVGGVVGAATQAARSRHSLDPGPDLVLTLLLAVGVLGIARLAATDGVLAVFVAGLAYNRAVPTSELGAQDGIDEAVNRYAVLPLLVLLGVVLPWAEWRAFGPSAVVFVAAVLLVRRLPPVLALARPLRLGMRDAVFAGWFGPMGVSAVFYLAYSIDEGVRDPRLFAAGTLVITTSVLAFGVSASPGRQLYARTKHF
ncbi:MAG: hypothetical protein K0Q93_733 [Nocardioidaceae bacterium]|nr:hypothetical protein [Nocardioidaceae bacterium]